MKQCIFKILAIILFIGVIHNIYGQGGNFITVDQVGKQYYAGSLGETSSTINYQKLKIEVFGGNWHKTNTEQELIPFRPEMGLQLIKKYMEVNPIITNLKYIKQQPDTILL